MSNNCKVCNIDISSNKKYCSPTCYHISLKCLDGLKNKVCLYCNRPFISKEKSNFQINANKFCSKKCRRIHQSIRQATGEYKICVYCNIKFYTKKCHSNYLCCSQKCANKFKTGKYYPKMSISRSMLIANGKCNPKRNFYKQGWYCSAVTGNKEWFGSSYEQRRMLQLDKLNVKWTKKHGIRIPYIDPLGNIRNYVPDFLIEDSIIEEVKPHNLVRSKVDNNNLKYDAAIEFCKNNNYTYRIITEKDLETINNKQ